MRSIRSTTASATTFLSAPSQFPVGKVAGSVFAKSSALIRRTGPESWELVIRRSFAEYIWLWLRDASREYGLKITA
ncbi:hypothetical protein CRX72_21215 [Pantoea sp. BRM17]|nr:hypothetical protein CRX72_21215 [Pantoea sp. BRM17]